MSTPWSTGCCGCFSDCGICCFGYFCLPCLYGNNSAQLHGGGCCAPCLLYSICMPFTCCFAGNMRGELRGKYNLEAKPCGDCFAHMPCWSALMVCQEAREMKVRGTNPQSGIPMANIAPQQLPKF